MPTFGSQLRHWRLQRRMSQADLAASAEVSTRHVSFVENGRAQPSRQMVLLLCSALDVPLRQRNELLHAAGFADIYRESGLDQAEAAPIRDALDFLLARMAPNGAAVFDRAWNLLDCNVPFRAVLAWLHAPEPVPQRFNIMRGLLDREGIGRYVVDSDDLAALFVERLRREAIATEDPELQQLFDEAARRVGPRRIPEGPAPALLPTVVRKDGVTLRTFSLIATLGTALDLALDGLRVELYFPADAETARFVELLAAASGGRS